MRSYFNSFLLMLQMLTRFPEKKELACQDDDFRRGSNFFFIIGIIIGVLQYTTYIILRNILPVYALSILLIILELTATGAFHVDGLGDTCDGFFAAKGSDKILDIMKDSRIGTFACIAIILDILIRFEGYKFIISGSLYGPLLIIIPALSRASIALICFIGRPAKEKGLGNLFINNVTLKEVMINYIGIIIICFLFSLHPLRIAFLITLSVLVVLIFNALCRNKIGGITGDSLGATNELVTLFALLFSAIKLLPL